MKQLKQTSELRITGRGAYNALKEHRNGVHTAMRGDDSQWVPKLQKICK
jgi:hypothetical protein